MFKSNKSRAGFSLIELLAVVTILGIIAAIVVPRVSVSSATAKEKVDAHNKATINGAIERWYVENGSWPSISTLNSDTDYFPDGVPVSPVNSSTYTINSTTKRVI